MKKEFIKPTCTVVAIEMANIIAGSFSGEGGPGSCEEFDNECAMED